MILPSLQRIERLSLGMLSLALLGTLAFQDFAISTGVALGGGIAVINFYALRRLLQAIFQSATPRKQALLTVLLTMKFGLIAIGIFLAVKYIKMNALALIIGFSIIVVAIFLEGFRAFFKSTVASSE